MFIDADLVMKSHVTRVVAQCFAVLPLLWLISRLLLPSTLKKVVNALVLSRLDYANSVLTCIVGKKFRVGAQRLDASDLRTSTIRLCFQHSDIAALVTNPRAHSIQTGGPGPPSTARQCSRITRTVHLAVQPSVVSSRSLL